MARRIIFVLLLASFWIGIGSRSAAQGGLTDELVLTLRDNGRTFTIPVGTRITLRIPHPPFTRLIYDPAILELLPEVLPPVWDDLGPTRTPEPPDFGPESAWRLIAIRAGITALAVESEPCRLPPCPMMPSFNFRVTIVVSGPPYPPPPPPVVTPYRSEKYIGTAYLNQTVTVQVGQVVILDLPFLTSQRHVQVFFDSAMLQPLPGQRLDYLPPQGWRFLVVQPGTSTLIVREDSGSASGGSAGMLFQVTITTAP